ncbi:MAG: hypothetical protein KC776_09520 [Myxococcales bacterium]|nr:hypothetical protein [Myxococcales bacterium]MCB9582859.1 hypothetical protein [Polyangiaceae bacterium]
MFDLFIALDGFGLNGFEGLAGIARLRCAPERDDYEIDVRFYPGLSGAHATQINPSGTLGFLGNLAQCLFFYDPRTLKEVRRESTLRWAVPDVPYSSQTHVVWLDDDRFVTVLGPDFHLFHMSDLSHPERLGAHGVTLPHAIKHSPSGRYLFYGAMDHDQHGYANQVGIFDLQTREHRVVRLPATVWHLGVHPTRDVFYAPTQRCTPQSNMEFSEYTIAHFKNYLFEIDGPSATVLRHLSIPKDLPGALTSDVVVTEDTVLYNCCASNVIAAVDLQTLSQVRYVDERVGPLGSVLHIRAGVSNLVEALSRANVLREAHSFVKALRIARGSTLDGSYGLQLSPCGRYLLSAHRGQNQVIVYSYPELRVLRRIPFPPVRRFFPEHLGWLDDPRLGFHHSALSTATL